MILVVEHDSDSEAEFAFIHNAAVKVVIFISNTSALTYVFHHKVIAFGVEAVFIYSVVGFLYAA